MYLFIYLCVIYLFIYLFAYYYIIYIYNYIYILMYQWCMISLCACTTIKICQRHWSYGHRFEGSSMSVSPLTRSHTFMTWRLATSNYFPSYHFLTNFWPLLRLAHGPPWFQEMDPVLPLPWPNMAQLSPHQGPPGTQRSRYYQTWPMFGLRGASGEGWWMKRVPRRWTRGTVPAPPSSLLAYLSACSNFLGQQQAPNIWQRNRRWVVGVIFNWITTCWLMLVGWNTK
jgi:hypothetical protein